MATQLQLVGTLSSKNCCDIGAVTALTWVEENEPEAGGAAIPQLALQGRARHFCPPPPIDLPTKTTAQVPIGLV